MRVCNACKRELPLSDYNKDRNDKHHGKQRTCRKCRKDYYHRMKAKDPDYVVKRCLWTRYRMTVEQWNAMLEEQGGGCAICGTTEPRGQFNQFHVDHCHDGGHVRGLLCDGCNRGLGYFKDNSERLIAAAAYVAKHDRKED